MRSSGQWVIKTPSEFISFYIVHGHGGNFHRLGLIKHNKIYSLLQGGSLLLLLFSQSLLKSC